VVAYGVLSPRGQDGRCSPSLGNCGKLSSSKEGEGARLARNLRMELDRLRAGGPSGTCGLGLNEEELVREDVEAVESFFVKIEYVADLEGPALLPRCCCGFVILLRPKRDFVLVVTLVDGLSVDAGLWWNARIVVSDEWRPGGGYGASGV
jgi:hypothetical protein